MPKIQNVVASYKRSAADGNQVCDSSSNTFRKFTLYFPTSIDDPKSIVTASASDTYITIPENGIYEIIASTRIVMSTTISTIQLQIELNGTNQTNTVSIDGTVLAGSAEESVPTTDGNNIEAIYTGRLSVNDVIRFKINKFGATNANIVGTDYSIFSIKKVAA